MNNQGENSAEAILKTFGITEKTQFHSYEYLYKTMIELLTANQFKVSLPSDQEIEKEARRLYPNRDIHRHAFKKGVEWLRSQEGTK